MILWSTHQKAKINSCFFVRKVLKATLIVIYFLFFYRWPDYLRAPNFGPPHLPFKTVRGSPGAVHTAAEAGAALHLQQFIRTNHHAAVLQDTLKPEHSR